MSFKILNLIPFSSKSMQNLSNNENKENVECCDHFGRIFNSVKYFWVVRGSSLTVGCTKTGRTVGCWTFGIHLKVPPKINSVVELPRERVNIPLLIVGLKYNNKGLICILEITCSKILRAIELPREIINIDVVSPSLRKGVLDGPLHLFDGVIAVGTCEGGLLLLDLCLQECENSITTNRNVKDEKNVCNIMDLKLEDIPLLESHKNLANLNLEHVVLLLNGDYSEKEFVLNDGDGTVNIIIERDKVVVSSVYYCGQLGSLLVGYNFGAWQIWDLLQMKLLYTSPIMENNLPVNHFAIQEPCDDPRAFCYVWVIYGNTKSCKTEFSLAVMYALLYDSKRWYDQCGFLYGGLYSCQIRFQRELRLLENVDEEWEIMGSHCTALHSVNKIVCHGNTSQEPYEDGFSYCFFTWNSWTLDKIVNTYLTVFDLNQWYKEQMPSFLHKTNRNVNSYTNTICISDFLTSLNCDEHSVLFDIKVDQKTLSQFKGAVRLEEHYYPLSLSFNLYTLSENNIVSLKIRGSQRKLLFHLITQGPICLKRPSLFYKDSINLGLTPLYIELDNFESDMNSQREFLLTVALEQQLIKWLFQCAVCFAESLVDGYNIDSFLRWAWQRVEVLKQNADSLCACLFDSSGIKFDSNSCNLLNNCLTQLKGLKDVYGYVLKKLASHLLLPESTEIQLNNLELIIVYLEVVQWSISVGLLCATPFSSTYLKSDKHGTQSVSCPFENINDYFCKRRTSMQYLKNKTKCDYTNLIFIDYLFNEKEKANFSKRKDGTYDLKLFLPSSLYNLVKIYFEDNISLRNKHSIFTYFLLDIAANLDKSRCSTVIKQLKQFPTIFGLSSSRAKIVKAFWELDHEQYSAAVDQLLHPSIRLDDMETWQHSVLLRTLLKHGQHKLALLYLQIKQPPILEIDDVCCVLSLYVSNNMLDEAYYFQKSKRIRNYEDKLIYYFFEECRRTNQLLNLLRISLDINDEQILMEYLKNIDHPQIKELQAINFLQKKHRYDYHDNHFYELMSNMEGSCVIRYILTSVGNCVPAVNKKVNNFIKIYKKLRSENITTPLSMLVASEEKNKKCNSNVLFSSIERNDVSLQESQNKESLQFLKPPLQKNVYSRLSTAAVYPNTIFPGSLKKQTKLNFRSLADVAVIASTSNISEKHKNEPFSEINLSKTTPRSILKKSRVNVTEKKSNRTRLTFSPNPLKTYIIADTDNKNMFNEEIFPIKDIGGSTDNVIAENDKLNISIQGTNDKTIKTINSQNKCKEIIKKINSEKENTKISNYLQNDCTSVENKMLMDDFNMKMSVPNVDLFQQNEEIRSTNTNNNNSNIVNNACSKENINDCFNILNEISYIENIEIPTLYSSPSNCSSSYIQENTKNVNRNKINYPGHYSEINFGEDKENLEPQINLEPTLEISEKSEMISIFNEHSHVPEEKNKFVISNLEDEMLLYRATSSEKFRIENSADSRNMKETSLSSLPILKKKEKTKKKRKKVSLIRVRVSPKKSSALKVSAKNSPFFKTPDKTTKINDKVETYEETCSDNCTSILRKRGEKGIYFRYRLTPKKKRKKKNESLVSLIRLRPTPIKINAINRKSLRYSEEDDVLNLTKDNKNQLGLLQKFTEKILVNELKIQALLNEESKLNQVNNSAFTDETLTSEFKQIENTLENKLFMEKDENFIVEYDSVSPKKFVQKKMSTKSEQKLEKNLIEKNDISNKISGETATTEILRPSKGNNSLIHKHVSIEDTEILESNELFQNLEKSKQTTLESNKTTAKIINFRDTEDDEHILQTTNIEVRGIIEENEIRNLERLFENNLSAEKNRDFKENLMYCNNSSIILNVSPSEKEKSIQQIEANTNNCSYSVKRIDEVEFQNTNNVNYLSFDDRNIQISENESLERLSENNSSAEKNQENLILCKNVSPFEKEKGIEQIEANSERCFYLDKKVNELGFNQILTNVADNQVEKDSTLPNSNEVLALSVITISSTLTDKNSGHPNEYVDNEKSCENLDEQRMKFEEFLEISDVDESSNNHILNDALIDEDTISEPITKVNDHYAFAKDIIIKSPNDSESETDDNFFDAEQDVQPSSSVQLILNSKDHEVIKIDSDTLISMTNTDNLKISSKKETLNTIFSTTVGSSRKSDMFNKAFVDDDDDSFCDYGPDEEPYVKFVYAWVCDKGVNTSFPYIAEDYNCEKSTEDPNINENISSISIEVDKTEIPEKYNENKHLKRVSQGRNVERCSQTINISKRMSLLQKDIGSSVKK